MNGGPGSTSLYGLFLEHGPFRVGPAGTLSRRRLTWASKYNVIYIDQPVGTGFSFTDSDEGHVKNQTDVARDLYEFCRLVHGQITSPSRIMNNFLAFSSEMERFKSLF